MNDKPTLLYKPGCLVHELYDRTIGGTVCNAECAFRNGWREVRFYDTGVSRSIYESVAILPRCKRCAKGA